VSQGEYEKVQQAADFLREQTALRPRVGLVLGSGLGAFAERLQDPFVIPYKDIPHFPVSTAIGHAGQLVIGHCGKTPVAVMQGRVHFYEGYSIQQVVFPTRVLGTFGLQSIVYTNAAGGIKKTFKTRGMMLMRDHINMLGANPLTGKNDDRFGLRFPDMTEAYSKRLRALAKKEAKKLRVRLFEGVYVAMHGPSYETPAEIRALARLGADAVGMSTVPEVIAAGHMGLEVLGLSVVTNMAAGISKQKINHEEVLEAGKKVEKQFTRLMEKIIPAIDKVLQ
jgi:purine-nucleoside phosphorylase